MKKHILVVASIFLFSSCFKRKDNALEKGVVAHYENDFENVIGWTYDANNVKTIVKGEGHSGNYFSKIDTVLGYSYMFSGTFDKLVNKPFKGIKASVWCKPKSLNADVALVIAVDGPDGKNIYWHGDQLKHVMKKADEWVEIISQVDIAPHIKPENRFTIYVWNTSKEEIHVDDMKVDFRQ